jgi:heat shock protein HslJ
MALRKVLILSLSKDAQRPSRSPNFLALAGIVLLIGGCSVARSPLAAAIEGHRWLIVSYFDGRNLVAAAETIAGLPPYVIFRGGGIEGTPGCGGFIGRYTLSGEEITVWAGFIIGGYCPPDAEPQNTLVSQALSGKYRIDRGGERVVLRDGDGTAHIVLQLSR